MYCSTCGTILPHPAPVICEQCKTSHWRNAKPSASALVTNGGKLLLVRRAHDPWQHYWDIPGGFCNADEHPISAAEREVLEETGLRIHITGFLGIWLDAYDLAAASNVPDLTLNAYYHAVIKSGSPTPNPFEVTETRWFASEALPEEIAFPTHLRVVLQAWREAHRLGQAVTPLPDRPSQGRAI